MSSTRAVVCIQILVAFVAGTLCYRQVLWSGLVQESSYSIAVLFHVVAACYSDAGL